MKQSFLSLVGTVLCLSMPHTAFPHTGSNNTLSNPAITSSIVALADESGITTVIDEETATLYINGTGEIPKNFYNTVNLNNIQTIVIGDGITSIGEYAFSSCTGVTSIEIPNSVTTIGKYAFSSCTGLTSIEIPNSVTTIGKYAFSGCTGLTTVKIGSGLTSVGDFAFRNCKNIEKLELDCSTIGNWFSDIKTSIKEVIFGDNVNTIGSSAFSGCTGLTTIEIPNSVTAIGNGAFQGCTGLTSIEIPNSVTTIGESAFKGCTGLTTVKIGSGLESVGSYAFQDCNNIEKLELNCSTVGSWFNYKVNIIKEVILGDNVTTIGSSAFSGCTGLTTIEIPNNVTTISKEAFKGCTGLTTIKIGSSLESVESDAFNECSNIEKLELNCSTIGSWFKNKASIKEVILGDNVNTIENSAFYDCTGLASIEIPNSVTTIKGYAFYRCAGLTSIEIPNSVTTIGSSAFSGTGLTSIEIPNSVTTIEGYAFGYCSRLTTIEIPNSVTTIGDRAFYSCIGLTTVKIGSGVTSVGNELFKGCNNIEKLEFNCSTIGNWFGDTKASIKEIIFGDNVNTIGSSAFSGCTGLTTIEIPNSITTIGSSAFSGCTGLTSIEIPNSVTTIGSSAFWGCTGKAHIDISNIMAAAFNGNKFNEVILGENVVSIEDGAFSSVNSITVEGLTPATINSPFSSTAVIYVPSEAYLQYRKADGWKSYVSSITSKGYDIVTVEAKAEAASSGILSKIGLDYVGAIRSLTVKGSINSYDIIQFRDKMPLLHTLDLSEATVEASDKPFYNGNCTSDNDLGAYAFYGLENLRSVKLPKAINALGAYMFYKCSNLENVEIPSTVKSIGTSSFYQCSKLENIILPEMLENIGSSAFYYCTSLSSIIIPNGVKTIKGGGNYNDGAFSCCSGLTSITLPNRLEEIERNAFYGCSKLKEIKMPPTVKKIGQNGFRGNSSLEKVHIPSSMVSIGDYAFYDCNNITAVYTYTVEPTTISENTFSCFETATLYVPTFSFYNYYWDENGWKRFLNLENFDEPYEYFYINNDYVLNDNTGYIEGADGENPDADINSGAGFIVEGEQGEDEEAKQQLGDVNIKHDGQGNGGSIIGDNNLYIDSLHIKIDVKGGRWYFFAFPYDIPFKNIRMENGSEYVFRYYDGEERATNGNGGWKDINENHLKAARGYIFQCSANDVLVLSIGNLKMKKEDKYNELVAHVSENLDDASWNFTGNPYISYYDIADMDYSAPVTIWDGSKYVAIRPGDDDYHFAPYEAFFVQKPETQSGIGFDGDKQMTGNQSKDKQEKQAALRRAKIAAGETDKSRMLVNIVLSNGEQDDRTRIVFNESQTHNYESSCDAAKFETAGVPQIYTIDDENVHYAINERPAGNGIVRLGYSVTVEGTYTIETQRMDVNVYILDKKEQYLHSLDEGAYTFTTDAGKFEDRFEILLEAAATGIDGVNAGNGESTIYDLMGRRVKRTEKGIYIVDGNKIRVK